MQELWVAVLSQAVLDALNLASFNAVDYRRDGDPRPAARQWILEAGEDFRTVCCLAGVDPDAVRDAVLAGRVGPLHLGSPETRAKRRPARAESRAA